MSIEEAWYVNTPKSCLVTNYLMNFLPSLPLFPLYLSVFFAVMNYQVFNIVIASYSNCQKGKGKEKRKIVVANSIIH